MLAHVGAASLAGEETEMRIIFYLVNPSPLGCPSHAITAERLKYLFFAFRASEELRSVLESIHEACNIFPHPESKWCNQNLFSFFLSGF